MGDKAKRQQRRSAEDAAFNKMLICLAVAVAVELVALLVKRFYVDFTLSDLEVDIASGLLVFFQVFRFVGLVLVAAGAVWSWTTLKKKEKAVLPLVCTGVALLLWIVTMFAYYMNERGVRILMALPVAGAVLVLIYFLYQQTFFVNALLTGGGMAALWLYRQYYQSHLGAVIVCCVLGWLVLAAVAVLLYRLSRSNGKLGERQLVPAGTSYTLTALTCVVTAVAMLLGLLLGAAAALYLMFVLVGWLFCQVVYYTVKLM
jgi:hypothetical protein